MSRKNKFLVRYWWKSLLWKKGRGISCFRKLLVNIGGKGGVEWAVYMDLLSLL